MLFHIVHPIKWYEQVLIENSWGQEVTKAFEGDLREVNWGLLQQSGFISLCQGHNASCMLSN